MDRPKIHPAYPLTLVHGNGLRSISTIADPDLRGRTIECPDCAMKVCRHGV